MRTLTDARILYEILRAVEHQCVGDAVFLGVLRYIALEKAEVENVDLGVVLHGELGKGVAVGVLDEQELAALAAALDHRLGLVGVQEHGVLVTAVQVLPLVEAVRFILAVVIGDMVAGVAIPGGDLLGRDSGQGDFIPGSAMEIIAEDFLRPLPCRRLDALPRTIGIVGPQAGPMVVGAVVDVLAAMGGENGKHVHRVHTRVGQHLQNSGIR